ncbi:MAG TPA: type III polyketide synthase [Acetobacteraceae bacterium]|nr:type III polyketide synthase [Acetobacteraceae bacterium]
MTIAHINRIGTAVPEHDIHAPFVAFAKTLLSDPKSATLFERMAQRSGIDRRYSFMQAGNIGAGEVDAGGFYRRGAFPGTAARMAAYERQAPALAAGAVEALGLEEANSITHLIVASCTGFTAPGLDLQLAASLGLRSDVQRSVIGFMGCSAAVPALRAARQAVLAEPSARVLVVNLELCSLHLQETADLETALSFLLFGDGAAAALVTAEETGLALGDFRAAIIPESEGLITWHIGDQGFLMHLSGKVPGRIAQALREDMARGDAGGILRGEGTQVVDLWAVHAGGRTVLDAVEAGLSLGAHALADSRAVLSAYGNMSSATVMFVLKRMMEAGHEAAKRGMAMAFGPGMVAETFRFSVAG